VSDYSARANKTLQDAPAAIRKAVFKQVRLLQQNLRHPPLHAKKYDESQDLWQARVTKGWRLYFLIQSDTYYIVDIVPHPK
jgi:mRNA-degrading endonuclease RelE of RelBE toxin-antitoxin system